MATLSAVYDSVPAVASTPRNSSTRFYHPALDAFRFSFFLVFLHHGLPHDDVYYAATGVPQFLAPVLVTLSMAGMYGVDVFFVLSAYLITELLLREKTRFGQVDVGSFYLRRILRIWPLYFAFIGLAAALPLIMPSQQLGWRAVVAFLFLSGNWWIAFNGLPLSVVYPLWSVSIEEQFYLVWPRVVRRLGERGLVVTAVALFLTANVVRFVLCLYTTSMQLWCNTFVRLDPIAVGILIAVLLRGETPRLPCSRWLLFGAGFGCVAVSGSLFIYMGVMPRVMIGYPLVALGSGAMLVALLSDSAVVSGGPFVYLGRISYGLYVFHPLGLVIAQYAVRFKATAGSFPHLLFRDAIAFVATLLMAVISFHVLEQPFLKLKSRFTYVLSRA